MTNNSATNSTAITQAIGFFSDSRPAWLWNADGSRLIWSNRAAQAFKRKTKRKQGGAEVVPIGRQVARTLRLGVLGRASLSRMQFTIGRKPVSVTCTCTPLTYLDGQRCLLVVGVDRIDKDHISQVEDDRFGATALFGANVNWVLHGADGVVDASSDEARQTYAQLDGTSAIGGVFPAGSAGLEFIVLNPDAAPETVEPESEPGGPVVEATGQVEAHEEDAIEAQAEEVDAEAVEAAAVEDDAASKAGELTSLLDRLAGNSNLYGTLDESDDDFLPPVEEKPETPSDISGETPSTEGEGLWRIIGEGFDADENAGNDGETIETKTDTETVERNSRYNFDELSRILSDRVGGDREQAGASPQQKPQERAGALVNLSDENLLLNRLPLGLLVFRDQQVLFANRTFADLIGYPDTTTLRRAGLAAIFPSADDEPANVGPVSHLLSANGDRVPVSARLQSIGWQGSPALLLSARREEDAGGTENAVREFAQSLAIAQGDGFVETSPAGIISAISGQAASMLERTPDLFVGRPIHGLVALNEGVALRAFLQQPARQSGAQRPYVKLKGAVSGLEVVLFAEGVAGAATGYFGLVRMSPPAGELDVRVPPTGVVDVDLLTRISRDIRNPLNAIAGFSDLIRADDQDGRNLEYARDIKSAGRSIADILDELEDYARIKDRDYSSSPSDFDLGDLLDEAVAGIRAHASKSRVLLRSSISLRLPKIMADRATLRQALLNLLASAIEQTPQGGQIIVSARQLDDGSVEVHVRDSSAASLSAEKPFVVFREGQAGGGEVMRAVRSSVGLSLTRSLLAVNACSLSVDPTPGIGTLMTLIIPADVVVRQEV